MVGELVKHKPLIREVVLYGIIGGISASIDGWAFYLLSQRLDIYASNFISINIGMTLSFLLNMYVNFKVSDRLPQRALNFFCVGYTGLCLSMIILYVGVDALHLPKMHAKILSVFVVAAVQFTLNKLITFKKVDIDGRVIHGYSSVQ